MRPLVQFLSTNGDGTGSTSINTDPSGGASYYIDAVPDVTSVAHIAVVRLIVAVRDTGAFGAGEFGNAPALTNGVSIVSTTAGGSAINLTPIPIRTNSGFGAYAYDVQAPTGTNDQALLTRWTFSKFTGDAAGLVLMPGDKLSANVSDNFSALIDFTICAQGYVAQAR